MSLTVSLYITLAGAIILFIFLCNTMKAIGLKNKQIADLKFEVSRLKALKDGEFGGNRE